MCQAQPAFCVSVCTCKLLKGCVCSHPINGAKHDGSGNPVLSGVLETVMGRCDGDDGGEGNDVSCGWRLARTVSLNDKTKVFSYLPETLRQGLSHTIGSYSVLIPVLFCRYKKTSLGGMRRLGFSASFLLFKGFS